MKVISRIAFCLTFLAFAIWLLSPQVIAQKQIQPLSIEDVLDTRQLIFHNPIDLSPDGKWVAYSVKSTNLNESVGMVGFSETGLSRRIFYEGDSEIWITNVNSEETIKLNQSKGSSWGPVWSPDGRSLAFFSDRDGATRIWAWQESTSEIRQVSSVIVRPVEANEVLRWSPNSQQILVKTLAPESLLTGNRNPVTPNNRATTSRSYSSDSTVRVFDFEPASGADTTAQGQRRIEKLDPTSYDFADLTLIDVATGAHRPIAERVFPRNYWFSPRGDSVAYLSKTGQEVGSLHNARYDLVTVSLKDYVSHTATSNISHGYSFAAASWSPNGDQLTFTDGTGDLFVVSATGGSARKVSGFWPPERQSVFRAPLWDAAGRFVYLSVKDAVWCVDPHKGSARKLATIPQNHIVDILAPAASGQFWSPDSGQSLIVLTREEDTLNMAVYAIDLASGKNRLLLKGSEHLANGNYSGTPYSFDTTRAEQQIAYISEDSQQAQDIWVADASFRNARRITRLNPHLEHYQFGKAQIIEWLSLDGQRLRGSLLLPSGYKQGRRYPLVVDLYGNALFSRYANKFGGPKGAGQFNLQLLATRGYAVLSPDAPLRFGTPMYDLAQTVLPGVNKAIEIGVVDPERLAVMGQSFGGYSTLALTVQTKRFKAAIVEAGYGNVMTGYGSLGKDGQQHLFAGWNETQSGRIGGTPWEFRERYIENSPSFYLDRVDTPVLLIHGSEDHGVKLFLAEEIFVGLRRLGKTVTLAAYQGEGHAFSRRANIIDKWERIFAWLDKFLSTPESLP